MTDIAAAANAYAEASLGQPMVWGESDCTSWAARWVEQTLGRPVPMPRWHSRDEALSLIAAAGNLEALWSPALEDYGLRERYGDPKPGDVGIIRTHVFPQIGGIFLAHGLFAWRAEPHGARLLHPRPRTIIKVWAVQ